MFSQHEQYEYWTVKKVHTPFVDKNMKIYTHEVKAHNAPVKSDPVLSGGQGDVGTDMQICDSLGVKLLTRLRFEFSHLNEHKFRHGFKDTLNLLYTCGAEVETTEYFLLHCQLYSTHRSELFDKIVKLTNSFRIWL